MTTSIYRVQDPTGRGPWRPGFSHLWIEDRPDLDNLPPWHIEFGSILCQADTSMHLGCGCRTLDQLRRWFTPCEFRRLRRYGFQAVLLDVDRILAESEIQLVFQRVLPLHKGFRPVKLY